MKDKLSIYIPTYNREPRLLKLLHSIERIDCDFLEEVIVSDNCSNYDIEKSLKENLSADFLIKLNLIRNPVNIGAPGNIRNAYYWCKTKWLWMIGDDDEVLEGSMEIIKKDIAEDSSCAQFRYSTTFIDGSRFQEDDTIIRSLWDLIDYYKNNKKHTRGNFVFMSNNIFNMELLAPYIIHAFVYSTSLTQLIPMLKALDDDDKQNYIRYREASIIRYLAPMEGTRWNQVRVMLAISTVSHIPFKSLDNKSKSDLLDICNCVDLLSLIRYMYKNVTVEYDCHMLHSVYHGLYKYVEPWYKKIFYYLMTFQIRTSIPICSSSINILVRIKRMIMNNLHIKR